MQWLWWWWRYVWYFRPPSHCMTVRNFMEHWMAQTSTGQSLTWLLKTAITWLIGCQRYAQFSSSYTLLTFRFSVLMKVSLPDSDNHILCVQRYIKNLVLHISQFICLVVDRLFISLPILFFFFFIHFSVFFFIWFLGSVFIQSLHVCLSVYPCTFPSFSRSVMFLINLTFVHSHEQNQGQRIIQSFSPLASTSVTQS